jgi:hypothetical protein
MSTKGKPDQNNEPPVPTPTLAMEDLLVAMSKDTFPEGAMCTGWVIASEWMDANGEYWTYVGTDDRNPPWRHLGILQWALDGSHYVTEDIEDEDDE